MALVKSYSDAVGNSYPESYWRMRLLIIDIDKQEIRLQFRAWKDATAYSENKSSIANSVREYVIVGDEYMSLATETPSPDIFYNIIATTAESYVLNKQDVYISEEESVSFFADATLV